MARTKNRGYQQTLAPTYTARLWKMGGYIRLSREDLQKINRGLDDSNSVKNQRDILTIFTLTTLTSLKAMSSMWMTATREPIRSAKVSSGSWAM